MKGNNSIGRLFQARKGFLLASFLFCAVYSLAYGVGTNKEEALDELSVLLLFFIIALFLVAMVEYFYLGKSSTRQFYQTLPIKFRTIVFFRICSDWVAFTGAYVLCYGILRVRLFAQFRDTITPMNQLFLKMYLFLLIVYLFLQVMIVNCKNPMLGLGMTIVTCLYAIVSLSWNNRSFYDFIQSDRYGQMALICLVVLSVVLFASMQNICEESNGLFYHKIFRLLVIAAICYPVCSFAADVMDCYIPIFDIMDLVQYICWILLTLVIYYADTAMLLKRGGM